MSDEPRRRSRFDEVHRDPPRKSRFDRRSRSRSPPPARKEKVDRRERSPVEKVPDEATVKRLEEAKAKAAATAAKLNAMLAANKKDIQHVSSPVVRVPTPATPKSTDDINIEGVYQQDGDFVKDIEINDHRTRYTLTKGSVQQEIGKATGADITTRGEYLPPSAKPTASKPALHLHVTSTTKEGLEAAVKKIEEYLSQDLPELIDSRRFNRNPKPEVERDQFGRRKWPEASIPIDLEPIPGFNLRAAIVGPQGQNVKHIQHETNCRVQIKGRGSGFLEHETGMESDDAMYLHIAGPVQEVVDAGKELAEGLVESIKADYENFKEGRSSGPVYQGEQNYQERGGHHREGGRNRHTSGDNNAGQSGYGHGTPGYENVSGYTDPSSYGTAGYGSSHGQQDYAAQAGYQQDYTAQAAWQQQQQQQYAGTVTQTAAADGAATQAEQMTPEQYQAWVTYYAAHPEQDPYAEYGGYATVMQYMSQYQGQYAPATAYAGSDGQGWPYGATAPNPAPAHSPSTAGYNTVPPPPGL